MKILVVDDSESIRQLMYHCISSLGHTVFQAKSGQEAIDFVSNHSIDLIMMDVDMPGLNGIQATQEIRQRAGEDWFPIIFLSAINDDETKTSCILAGGDAYIVKPISPLTLQLQILAMERIYRMRLNLNKAHQKLGSILEAVNEGIITTDQDGKIETANKAIEEIYGYTYEELKDKNIAILDKSFQVWEDEANTNTTEKIITTRRKNGEEFPAELRLSRFEVEDKLFYTSIVRDITERKKAEQALEQANQKLLQLTLEDQLTGIANRRCFDETLSKEFLRSRRDKTPISLILCDIDYFKIYNDQNGHIKGDQCLQQVASIIAEAVRRPADVACRYGGEEFAVILPQTDLPGAAFLAEQIRKAVWGKQIEHTGSNIEGRVTLSLGVAVKDEAIHSVEQLIQVADQALYQAKEAGRNQVKSAALTF